ncbi:galactosyl transferase gma12 mnn10 family [Fusarium beomiforme]|uniref:Galactosyl transferase gma12 mnn10 family n=1 Tax=Fusarium beomiforme TaxID=44412 RepID=A0A9P5AJY6_9HYPO|nr:galactosyl transferase gma12 mnn10 family [Fusarium beomiforme]
MLQVKSLPWSAASLALKTVIFFFAILICYQAYTFYGDWNWPKYFAKGTNSNLISLIHPHGGNQCLPYLNSSLLTEAKTIRNACRHMPPYLSTDVRIGRVTAHFGSVQEHYQKALRTHVLHSMIHGDSIEVMCTPVVDSLWNKPAFILSLLLDEMVKPSQERLEWLFWVDRDTLILDQCRPLSSFLPPHDSEESDEIEDADDTETERKEETKYDGIHLLVTNDWNGLNNGVFFVRVNQWAIDLFSDIAAFRYYRPNVSLPFTEQSAMEIVMNEPKFKPNVQVVPQEWFNAYPKGSATDFDEKTNEDDLRDYHARRGDFLLHFAGRGGRDKLINEWIEMLGSTRSIWPKEEVQRNASTSIRGFWYAL